MAHYTLHTAEDLLQSCNQNASFSAEFNTGRHRLYFALTLTWAQSGEGGTSDKGKSVSVVYVQQSIPGAGALFPIDTST
jgi:hypothetical protein